MTFTPPFTGDSNAIFSVFASPVSDVWPGTGVKTSLWFGKSPPSRPVRARYVWFAV